MAALLAGCASYRAKPLEPEKTAAAFEARSLSDAGLAAYARKLGRADWPPAAWDADALTVAALYYHPDLAVARAQREGARAGIRAAGERPNPTLGVSPLEWINNPSQGLSPWVTGFSLDIPVETAGKRGARLLKARAAEEQARLGLAAAVWQARGRVRAALVAAWSAERAEDILAHQQEELATNERLLSERAAAGQVSPLSAAQAVLLAGRSTLLLEDARRLRSDAVSQLADALALPRRETETLAFSSAAYLSIPALDPAAVAGARRAALLGRPDVLAALAAYAGAEADLRLEVARQYPDLHLGPGFTWDQKQDKWAFGFSVPLPIMNRNGGAIAQARARRAEAQARFEALQQKVIADVDRASAAYAAAAHKLSAADAVLARHERQDSALRKLMRPGDVSRLALFQARLDLDSTRLSRQDALAQAQLALLALEDALQKPLVGEGPPAAALEIAPGDGAP